MSFSQYRGVRISLLSRSDIRYEGVLDDVNPETSSIALTNVRSFGTEGRRGGNPLDEIPPQDKVFPYICFRASDVKDLTVLEEANPEPAPAPEPVLQDPAIIDYAPPQAVPVAAPPADTRRARNNHQEPQRRGSSRSPSPSARRNRGPPRSHDSDTHASRSNNHRRNHHPRNVGPVLPKGEYDFAQANAKLDKEALAREFGSLAISPPTSVSNTPDTLEHGDSESGVVIPPPKKQSFYDRKSSFFDNISCEAKERAESGGLDYHQRRQRMNAERRANLETFGVAIAGHQHRQYGSGHRGGHRGGRGGGGSSSGGYRPPATGGTQ